MTRAAGNGIHFCDTTEFPKTFNAPYKGRFQLVALLTEVVEDSPPRKQGVVPKVSTEGFGIHPE